MIFGRITSCSGSSALLVGPASARRPSNGYPQSLIVTRKGSVFPAGEVGAAVGDALSGIPHRPRHPLGQRVVQPVRAIGDRCGACRVGQVELLPLDVGLVAVTGRLVAVVRGVDAVLSGSLSVVAGGPTVPGCLAAVDAA